jgi:hypothetical protein
LALALTLLFPSALRAQGTAARAEPRIEVADCPDGQSTTLPALVKLEIDVLIRERGPARAPPDHIVIRCTAERVHLEVAMRGRVQDSSIVVGALAPDHRPRAIALAAAELVHSMSNRPERAPPKPAAPAPPPSGPPLEHENSAWRRPALAAGVLTTWLGTPSTVLFGARAVLHTPVSALIAPAFSVEAATGGFHADAARISATALSAGASLRFGVTTGAVRWDAGPGARFGWVRLSGEPDAGASLEGGDVAGAWGGVEARARAAYAFSPSASPLLAIELGTGLVTLPVRGLIDGAGRAYAVEGLWVSASAQVGIAL